MILFYNFRTIGESATLVTSEETGYDFDNAILYYDKPWLSWRSTSTAEQTITLYWSGSAITCLAIFGANFSSVTVGGSAKTLGYNRIFDEYRGLFTFSSDSSPIAVVIPAQTVSESYYTMSGILIGNYVTLTSAPVGSIQKNVTQPVHQTRLESGIEKQSGMGGKYHTVTCQFAGMDYSALTEIRDFKRTVGRTEPFVMFENFGDTEDCYLCRRTDNMAYTCNDFNNFQETLVAREISCS